MKKVIFAILGSILIFSSVYASSIGAIRIASLLNLGKTIPAQQIVDKSIDQATETKLLKTPIPNGFGNFTQILESTVVPSKNKSPDFAFIGLGANNQLGVYYSQAGKLNTIVNNTIEIPGGTDYFQSIYDLTLFGRNNQIAFIGKGILSQNGIYIYNGKKLINAVDQRSVTPRKDALFVQFFHLGGNQDLLVFSAIVDNRVKGIYGYQANNVYKIITQADEINKQKISDLSMPANSLKGNKLLFNVTLPKNQQVNYLATLDFI